MYFFGYKNLLFYLDIVLPEPSCKSSENEKDCLIWPLKRLLTCESKGSYLFSGGFLQNYASFGASIKLKFCQVIIQMQYHLPSRLQRNASESCSVVSGSSYTSIFLCDLHMALK